MNTSKQRMQQSAQNTLIITRKPTADLRHV